MNGSYHQSYGTFSARSTSLAELVTSGFARVASLSAGAHRFSKSTSTIPTTIVAAKRGRKLVVNSDSGRRRPLLANY